MKSRSGDKSWLQRRHFWILAGIFPLLLVTCGSPTVAPETFQTEPVQAKPTHQVSSTVVTGDWSTYLANNGRSGFSQAETKINATTAPNLKQYWAYRARGSITTQPIEAFGMIYWGSWDGLEHATDLQGNEVWATKLGNIHTCGSIIGVASTATAASVTIGGKATPVIFVGGGNVHFYALNALTGAMIWDTTLGAPPAQFIWSSPILYKGSIYVGMASVGDCPEVQGQLIRLNETTGAIEHILQLVPGTCLGATVWGSPTIDDASGDLYIATGNTDQCSTVEPYAVAVLEVHASNLQIVGSWQVPRSQWVIDPDFGDTPTLFTAKIKGTSQPMVGVAHKNGIYYAFKRGALNQGPVWETQIAQGGSCPNCGSGSISPSAWDGKRLYVAGGYTAINGTTCRSGLRALDPATGTPLWQDCLPSGPVVAAVTSVPGVVVADGGSLLVLVDASSGKTLFSFTDPTKGALFYGAPSIAHGVLYVGNFDGFLYAFGV